MNISEYNIFSFALVAMFVFSASLAHAETASTTPNIQTFNTATSSTVIITAPTGFKNEVISNFDGNQFHTFTTSTPLTAADIQNIQTNIQAEETAMQNLIQQQDALFKEQEQLFQNMWNNISW
jgi:hypothetical protein